LPAPDAPQLLAVLQALYSDQEAELVAGLPFKPAPLTSLARQMGRDVQDLGAALASLADRGLVYERRAGDEVYYSMLPLVPGLAELQFMSGETSPAKTHLARLLDAYYPVGLGLALTQAGAPYSRVIPVGAAIRNQQEILPHEIAVDIVRQQRHIALATCYCRHEAELLGHGCVKPKDVCLTFGAFAEFAVAKGLCQPATQEQALAALERAANAGLVHVSDNVVKGANFLCNCCGCCCMFLRTITKLERPGAVAQAAYLARVDADQCIACGQCLEACQVKAFRPEDETYSVDPGRCLGCGQCSLACPTGAITMDRRKQNPPPSNFVHLMSALAKKGGSGGEIIGAGT
jgi:NAD-dependent dihydropyrimidine dehydrogenase PreA subunit